MTGQFRQYFILREPWETPPKDCPFVVFSLEYVKDNRILRGTNKSRLIWMGLALWNEDTRFYEIETTSTGEHNGIVCLEKLESNMRWAIFPDSWIWSKKKEQ